MNASAENARIGESLLEAARLIDSRAGPSHRAAAYRAAGNAISHYPYDVRRIFEREGVKGLDGIPRVGLGIASAVAEMLATDRWVELEALRHDVDPAMVFQSVPGVGEKLARRIRDELHVDSLEALENAANDGQLERLPGVGPRRAAALRGALDHMLRRARRPDPQVDAPAVELLLDVDREYREAAAAVLHTRRGAWRFTALHSNTALARRLGRVRDWVVICYRDARSAERQCTVVTETRGPLAGRRVVRGREDECPRP